MPYTCQCRVAFPHTVCFTIHIEEEDETPQPQLLSDEDWKTVTEGLRALAAEAPQ